MSAIATFFADMQFRVDSSGLTAFRSEMALVKREMGNTLAILHATSKALKNTLKDFGKLQHTFDAKSMSSWRKSIAAAARAYVKVMEASNGVLHQVAQEASKSQIKLSNFEKRLNSNIVALNSYAQALMPVVLLLERLRGAAGSPLPRVGGGFRGGANGAGNGSGGHGGAGRPPSGAGTGLLETAGIMAFLKPMLPMGMGLGGMLGGGYAFRELIGAGREMFGMELKMKAVSKDSESFANNMAYVKKLSQGLGIDIVAAGNAYAQIVVTAQDKMQPEKMQKMFTGFNKYYAAVHMTEDKQKLANLAIQQMFGKDKIQAQEARLQMGQNVTPFIKLLTEAAKAKFGKAFTNFDDMMKRGLLDPTELLPDVADKLAAIAENGGSLEEALKNSQVAQIRFNNSLKEFSYIVMKGGLDHALAVMFAYGSEAVPMAAKAFKELVHIVKNLFTFLKVAVTDFNTVVVSLEMAFASLGIAMIVALTGGAAGFTFLWKAAGMASTVLGGMLVILRGIAATVAPIALMITGLAALSEFLDILAGKDVQDSWLGSIVYTIGLLLSNIRVWMSDFELWLIPILAKLNLLPENMGYNAFNETKTSSFNNATETLLGARKSDSGQIKANIEAFSERYKTPINAAPSQVVQPINVQVNLPQMTPQQAAILQTGDMSAFGEAMGQAASKEFRFYNPSTY